MSSNLTNNGTPTPSVRVFGSSSTTPQTLMNKEKENLNSVTGSLYTPGSSFLIVNKFNQRSSVRDPGRTFITPLSDLTTVDMSGGSRQNSVTEINYHDTIRNPFTDISNAPQKENIHNSRGLYGPQIAAHVQATIHRDLSMEFEEAYSDDEIEDFSGTDGVDTEIYHDLGDPVESCQFCRAIFWKQERSNKKRGNNVISYSKCCREGGIQLPELATPPSALYELFFGSGEKSKHFIHNIRSYNTMFSFTSMGGKVDRSVNTGNSPPVYKISGQNYHLMGSLLPVDGSRPKFAQLYIYDTQNELTNRLSAIRCTHNLNNFLNHRPDGNYDDLHQSIIADLSTMFDEYNVLVKSFRRARDEIETNPSVDVKIKLIGRRRNDARTYNLPSVDEVAALIVGDIDHNMGERDILIETKCRQLKRINQLNPAYLALQYPILFPYGEDGFREDIPFSNLRGSKPKGRKSISPKEYLSYYIHDRVNKIGTLTFAKRLFQQFLVDGYTMVEASRLIFIRTHQKTLRCDAYRGLSDALTRGEVDPSTRGKRVILPSTFTGGARYMIQNYQDAMSICKWIGYPHLFITFTCNPKWPEIERYLEHRNLKAEDRPDIVCRLFKMKLDCMVQDIRKNKLFGIVKSVIYTIEFQKRGLPHAHILLFLDKPSVSENIRDINDIISAEIPDSKADPLYYNDVVEFMLHGPCGDARKDSPCMDRGKCTKYYPKRFNVETILDRDGYPVYRRRDDGVSVKKNGTYLDNRHVVPHNRYLLTKYRAHINVEWCNQSRSIKYLFKYVNKGNDRVTAEFYRSTTSGESEQVVDEINMFYDCRYISSCEATWRLLGYEIHYRTPAVERLNFHLENQQTVFFEDQDVVTDVMNKETVGQSMFLAWFKANEKYELARSLTYAEMPHKFVWKKTEREWRIRKRGFSIGRMFYVPPGCGEIYYLRCLLNLVRGPKSYADIRTVSNVVYETFRDACYARGLLDDDKEYVDAIKESSFWATAFALRRLFVTLLTSSSMSRPEVVWRAVWQHLSDDVERLRRRQSLNPDLVLTDEDKQDFALIEMARMLAIWGKSLSDFPQMPLPNASNCRLSDNMLMLEELAYDREQLKTDHESLIGKLTDEQKHVYDSVMTDVYNNGGRLFFVNGYGGTGKTFVWRTLSTTIRSRGDIVLNVASSGIASLLLPGGRTAHSRFAIPISLNEDSTCNISQGSHLAELLIKSKLIIWDEAPMVHKYCFEALDKTLRDLMRFTVPNSDSKTFGGKTVVFGGDFRQILPVITKGTRQQIVGASINSSYLWNNCIVLKLTKNLRLQSLGQSDELAEVEKFSKWIARIGDGTLGGPNDGFSEIDIPNEFLIHSTGDHIGDIVDSTYPMFRSCSSDPSFLEGRAILSPTLDVVDNINQYMSDLNTQEGRTYFSSDSMCRSDSGVDTFSDIHTPEFLNGLKCSGLPNHALTLKVGSPVMLLRNIDHSIGLCNGTRLIITRLADHVLEAKIMTGTYAGTLVLIPRMTLTPSDLRLPFKFKRRQFPLMISYAMTINKSQGQTLSHVGLFLKKPVFNHGQLYVALSRVSNPRGLKILALNEAGEVQKTTTNVVYKEVFNNL